MNSTCTSHELHVNSTRTSREPRLKPVNTAKGTSRALHVNLYTSNTFRVISLKNNNLLHVLSPDKEQEYKDYLSFLREGEVNVNTSREDLLTATEAGKLLNKTARQVYTYIRQGKLREVKVTVKGRERIRVPLEDVKSLREELGVSHEVHVNTSREEHVNSTGSSREVHVPEIVESAPEPPRPQIIPVVDVLQVAQLKQELAELTKRQEMQEQKYLAAIEKLTDKIDKLTNAQTASTKEIREEFNAKLEAEIEKLNNNQITANKEIREWATIELKRITEENRPLLKKAVDGLARLMWWR